MPKINKILCPTDFSSCGEQAWAHAVFLARKYQAELHVLHLMFLFEEYLHDDMYGVSAVEELYRLVKENTNAQMNDFIKTQNISGLDVKKVKINGNVPAPGVLNYASEYDIDLIVMGTHGYRGLRHLFLGSVAEEVVRLAKCPVLTIREHEAPKPIEKKQILVPVDFSKHAIHALTYANEIAATYGAQLQLLHVIEQRRHPDFYTSDRVSTLQYAPEIKAKSRKALESLCDELPEVDVETKLHIVEGQAAHEIVTFAERHDSDLIVIATHGLTGIEHFLLGSVSEKVVKSAACPVLTIKAFGKSIV